MKMPGGPLGRSLIRNVISLRPDTLVAQGMRFALSGVVVAIVYISITTVLSAVLHMPFDLALILGWSTAVMVHFTLQRLFVWSHQEGFALALRAQVGRYMIAAVLQLCLTATTTSLLPSVLGLPVEVVYLATAMLVTLVNFLVFRNGIFHAEATELEPVPVPVAVAEVQPHSEVTTAAEQSAST